MFACNWKDCQFNDVKKALLNQSIIYQPCKTCYEIFYCSNQCKELDKSSHACGKQTAVTASAATMNASTVSATGKAQSQLDYTHIIDESMNQSMTASSKKSTRSLEDYEFVNIPKRSTGELGKGAFGEVRLIKEKATGKLFALKQINKKNLKLRGYVDQMKKEIKLQKKLNFPHILKLFHKFEDQNNVYFVLEWAEKGSVFNHLKKKRSVSEEEAFYFFIQTALAVDHLHQQGIIHRDLKPENLLLDANGNIKVCDFGWSTQFSDQRYTHCGTPDYMCPEILRSEQHDHTVDIWALGILLFELLNGFPPFSKQGSQPVKMMEEMKISEKNGIEFKKPCSTEAKDLITKILRLDNKTRLNFTQIYSHPWCVRMLTTNNWKIEGGVLTSATATVPATTTANVPPKSPTNTKKPGFSDLFDASSVSSIPPKSPTRSIISANTSTISAQQQSQRTSHLRDMSPGSSNSRPGFSNLFAGSSTSPIGTNTATAGTTTTATVNTARSVSPSPANTTSIQPLPSSNISRTEKRTVSPIFETTRKSYLDNTQTTNRSMSPNRPVQAHSTLFQAAQKTSPLDATVVVDNPNDLSTLMSDISRIEGQAARFAAKSRSPLGHQQQSQQQQFQPSFGEVSRGRSPAGRNPIEEPRKSHNKIFQTSPNSGFNNSMINNNNTSALDSSSLSKSPNRKKIFETNSTTTAPTPARSPTPVGYPSNTGTTTFTATSTTAVSGFGSGTAASASSNSSSNLNNILSQGLHSKGSSHPFKSGNTNRSASPLPNSSVTANTFPKQQASESAADITLDLSTSSFPNDLSMISDKSVLVNTAAAMGDIQSISSKYLDKPRMSRPAKTIDFKQNDIANHEMMQQFVSKLKREHQDQIMMIERKMDDMRKENEQLKDSSLVYANDQLEMNRQYELQLKGQISELQKQQKQQILEYKTMEKEMSSKQEKMSKDYSKKQLDLQAQQERLESEYRKLEDQQNQQSKAWKKQLSEQQKQLQEEYEKRQKQVIAEQERKQREFEERWESAGLKQQEATRFEESFINLQDDQDRRLDQIRREYNQKQSDLLKKQEEFSQEQKRLDRNQKDQQEKLKLQLEERTRQLEAEYDRKQQQTRMELERKYVQLETHMKEEESIKKKALEKELQLYKASSEAALKEQREHFTEQYSVLEQSYIRMEKEQTELREEMREDYERKQKKLEKEQKALSDKLITLTAAQQNQLEQYEDVLAERTNKLEAEFKLQRTQHLQDMQAKQTEFAQAIAKREKEMQRLLEQKRKQDSLSEESFIAFETKKQEDFDVIRRQMEVSFMADQEEQRKKMVAMEKEFKNKMLANEKSVEDMRLQQMTFTKEMKDYLSSWQVQAEESSRQLQDDYAKLQKDMREEFTRRQCEFEERLKQRGSVKPSQQRSRGREVDDDEISRLEQSYLDLHNRQAQKEQEVDERFAQKSKELSSGQKEIARKQQQLEENALRQRDSIQRSIQSTMLQLQREYENKQQEMREEFREKQLGIEEKLKTKDAARHEKQVTNRQKEVIEEQYSVLEESYIHFKEEQDTKIKQLEGEYKRKQKELEKEQAELREKTRTLEKGQEGLARRMQADFDEKTQEVQENYEGLQSALRAEFEKKQAQFEERMKNKENARREDLTALQLSIEQRFLRMKADATAAMNESMVDQSFMESQREATNEFKTKQKLLEKQYVKLQEYCQQLEKKQIDALLVHQNKVDNELQKMQAIHFKQQLEIQKEGGEQQQQQPGERVSVYAAQLQRVTQEAQNKCDELERKFQKKTADFIAHTAELKAKFEHLERIHLANPQSSSAAAAGAGGSGGSQQKKNKKLTALTNSNRSSSNQQKTSSLSKISSVDTLKEEENEDDDDDDIDADYYEQLEQKKKAATATSHTKASTPKSPLRSHSPKPPRPQQPQQNQTEQLQQQSSLQRLPIKELIPKLQITGKESDEELKKVLLNVQDSINKLNTSIQSQNDLSMSRMNQSMADLSMESNLSKIRRIQLKKQQEESQLDEYYDPMINRTYLEQSILNSSSHSSRMSQKQIDILNESSLRRQARENARANESQISTISEDSSRIVREKVNRQHQREQQAKMIENRTPPPPPESLGFIDRLKYVFGCTTRR